MPVTTEADEEEAAAAAEAARGGGGDVAVLAWTAMLPSPRVLETWIPSLSRKAMVRDVMWPPPVGSAAVDR